jgi:hypothetical protein
MDIKDKVADTLLESGSKDDSDNLDEIKVLKV